jgi:multidrug efflux pump subunit AcrA (membrane-fusion protein)
LACAALSPSRAALTALQQGTSAQQVAIDQSQVQIDQINVDNAQKSLSQATLTAPVDGVVGQVNITVGQISGSGTGSSSSGASAGGQGGSAAASSSSSSSSSSTHAIVILNPGAYEVVGSVSDVQVNQVAAGQLARVTVAGSSQAITGRVTTIAPEATVTSGVATFPVTVVLDGSNPSLHSGVSASIAVVVNQVVHVLTVPSSAIRPSGGGDSVQTLVNGQPVSVPVTVGASDALRTQILSGLNEGDTVVIATVSSVVPTPNVNSLFGGRGGAGGGRTTGRGGAAPGG